MRAWSLWAGFTLTLAVFPLASISAEGPFTVTFVIDMREEIAARRFDPAKDVIGVRSGTDPLSWGQTLAARDEDGDGRYEVKVSFPERPFGGQPVTYKFKVDSPRTPADLHAGWEKGKNRLLFLNEPTQTVARRFDEPALPIQPVRTGTIRAHPGFESKFLGPRDLLVYLPPGYDKESSRRYPVLYMNDGQNVFDASEAGMEWQMDEIAEKLIGSGQIEPVIIVGVSSTEARGEEYTPTYLEWKRPDGVVFKGGGQAGLYGRLLIEELKPFIDRTYRTLPEPRHTGLGGASHGGLVSLYLGLKHPDVFGNLLVVSPSAWWDDHVVVKTVAALPAKTAQRIWVDMGSREGEEMLGGTRRLRDALLAKGWKPGTDLHYLEQERAGHDEIAWAARVEPMLRFLYGQEDVAETLHRQTQELIDAVTSGSAAVWERYLEEKAVYTAEDGSVSTKAQMVAQIRPLPEGVSGNLKVIDFKATLHGSVAVTNYVIDEDEVYHGHKLHCQYRNTDTWLKTPAGWRLIAGQVLALRTDPPAVPLTARQMEEYAGSYTLTPTISYEIRLKDGGLEGQQTGRKAEPLKAEVADVLFVPGKPRYRKIFQRGSGGRITGFVERREAWDLEWTRRPPGGR